MDDFKRSAFRERAAAGRSLLGLMQLHPSVLVAELAGSCGYDFLFLDAEHGGWSLGELAQSFTALAKTDTVGLVRVPGHDVSVARQYVAAGAEGIIVPHISTAEEAAAQSQALSSHATLIVVIESKLGVANAHDIAKVEGVDGVIVGPYDLTADLGCAGDFAHPLYAESLARIEAAAAEAGKIIGTIPHGSYTLSALHARGHRLFIIGGYRSLLQEAMSAHIASARSAMKLPA